MKKCVLLLLLMWNLCAIGQCLSTMKPVNFTARQDSIVKSFAATYKPIYTVDGRFRGYFKINVSASPSTKSIMLQQNRIPFLTHSIIQPTECEFLVLDPPPLFQQWGWTRPPTFFESVCDLLIDAIL